MKDLMLDIETLGTRPTSVITQIGACYFDRNTGEIGGTFLGNIDVDKAIKRGLTLDWQAIKWWFEQENKSWMENTVSLSQVLGEFIQFAKKAEYVWSHSTFDIPILINAYAADNRKQMPFHYRATRDIRTLTHLAGHQRNENKTDPKDKTHNALEDCVYQVKYCVECFNKLKR